MKPVESVVEQLARETGARLNGLEETTSYWEMLIHAGAEAAGTEKLIEARQDPSHYFRQEYVTFKNRLFPRRKFLWDDLYPNDEPLFAAQSLEVWAQGRSDLVMLSDDCRSASWVLAPNTAARFEGQDCYFLDLAGDWSCYISTHEPDCGPYLIPLPDWLRPFAGAQPKSMP
jgi:hypothetical protein